MLISCLRPSAPHIESGVGRIGAATPSCPVFIWLLTALIIAAIFFYPLGSSYAIVAFSRLCPSLIFYRGIFPCFFGGLVSRLLMTVSSAFISVVLVSRG